MLGGRGRKASDPMDKALIVIVVMAALSLWALWRLALAVRRVWDGDFEDLDDELVIRRLKEAGLSLAGLAAALLLRGVVRDWPA